MATKQEPHTFTLDELIAMLHQDLTETLKLRDANHFRSGRPDEDGCETYEEYLAGQGEHDGKWERWANATYNANNKMGGYLGHAISIVEGLEHWLQRNGERDDVFTQEEN